VATNAAIKNTVIFVAFHAAKSHLAAIVYCRETWL